MGFRVTRLVPSLLAFAAVSVTAESHSTFESFVRPVVGIPMAWRIERESDAALGHNSCVLASRGGDVVAHLFKARGANTATWSVRVGSNNQPGSVRYLRINTRIFQTDQPSFSGNQAMEIVRLLKSPGEFAFEWAERPDFAKRAGLFGTGDFAAKAAACERWIFGMPV